MNGEEERREGKSGGRGGLERAEGQEMEGSQLPSRSQIRGLWNSVLFTFEFFASNLTHRRCLTSIHSGGRDQSVHATPAQRPEFNSQNLRSKSGMMVHAYLKLEIDFQPSPPPHTHKCIPILTRVPECMNMHLHVCLVCTVCSIGHAT